MQFTGDFVKIHTDTGDLRGKRVKNVYGEDYYSFQGIPYAKPPIGELRFKDPEPIEPWTGVRDALCEGSVAPAFSITTRRFIESSSEDCLFLNIYTTNLTEPKPVMFFIHGGSFQIGSGNTDFYGPDYLIRKDVILVTCNYRLGPLGFLSLGTKKHPGNYGLKDIVTALKWLRQNVKYFGGDHENVTIFGESAGGAAVEFLMLSKSSRGLFHKAISQSGSALSPWALSRKPREYAYFLGELLGCKTQDDDELVSFLKSVPPEDLITNGKKVLRSLEPNEKYERSAFIPCVEPESETAIITKTPKELYESGDYQYIPFMTGLTNGEGIVYLDDGVPVLEKDEDLERFVPSSASIDCSKEIIQRIKKHYFPNGFDINSYIQILSSIYFLNGINFVVENMQKNRKRSFPIYYYLFSFDGEGGFYKIMMNLKQYQGVCHCDELGYLFKVNLMDYVPEKESKEDKMLETMTKLWTNFAKFNDPTPKSEIAEWKPVDSNNKYYLDIGDSLVLKSDLCHSEIQFWKDIFRFISNRQD